MLNNYPSGQMKSMDSVSRFTSDQLKNTKSNEAGRFFRHQHGTMGVEAQEARQIQCSSCLLRKNRPFSDLRQGSAHPQPLCSKELPQFLRGCIQEHVRPQIQRRLLCLWAIITRRGQSAAVESGKTAQFGSFPGVGVLLEGLRVNRGAAKA